MSKHKVVLFEMPSADMKKSKEFYESALGWTINLMEDNEGGMAVTAGSDDNGMATEVSAINGGFYKRESKSDHPSIVIETESIDETAKAIEKAGGKITTAKHAIGDWGFMADFTDPEGNEMALWEKKK